MRRYVFSFSDDHSINQGAFLSNVGTTLKFSFAALTSSNRTYQNHDRIYPLIALGHG